MDTVSAARRSANMRAIHATGTTIETEVARYIRRLGYSFKTHAAELPGRPDFVFPRAKKVIFVHGCFWHQHTAAGCREKRMPKSNLEYWSEKLARNVRRDRRSREKLKKMGWSSIVLWECQIPNVLRLAKIERFLKAK